MVPAAYTRSYAREESMYAGVLCVGLPKSECDRLDLPLMVPTAENEESMYTAFTVTVDLREGITTGISASDRCATVRALGDPGTTAAQLRKPGHIFPLIARDFGVLTRPGHTEASVDLARLAGAPLCSYDLATPRATLRRLSTWLALRVRPSALAWDSGCSLFKSCLHRLLLQRRHLIRSTQQCPPDIRELLTASSVLLPYRRRHPQRWDAVAALIVW